MMHEITVSGINVTNSVWFGMAKSDHGEYQGSWFWNRTSSRTCVSTDCIDRDGDGDGDRDRE